MDECVANLERVFKGVVNDLSFVSHRLQESGHGDHIPSLLTLNKRLHGLVIKMADIQNKCDHLVQLRMSNTTDCVESLLGNYEILMKAIKSNNVNPDFDVVEPKVELLNSLKSKIMPFHSYSRDIDLHSSDPSQETISDYDTMQENLFPAKMNSKLIKGNDSFVQILTEEKFDSLSKLIKGRCKYEDVRRLYDKLVADYRKQIGINQKKTISSPLVSFQELDHCGLKVFGKTGESVILCLRTLNIISVFKTGLQLKLKNI